MELSNIRSLLIAAIVLSNCVTWTSSRHHFTHNVNGHRSRHRRQGAGLFLPSSYVIPGGEGSPDNWGNWLAPSPCSRTCGGGVASQKRICLVNSGGQSNCIGGDTRYFSCQTQDCPDDSKDFRAEQCSEFDHVAFKGIRYQWVPYTRGPNPCELNCMPRGERFYYRQREKVVDGTRCNEESFDVCVNGTCRPVGCDMMLGSLAREDKCRVCRGDGANCHTVKGLLDTQDLRNGYNDILLIPQGATSIYIEEVRPSSNYLAIRAKNNTYYLNGDYHIDFPRSIIIAGVTWHYERSQDGLPSPDKLRCQGPTDEPLLLSILLQEPNVGVSYEYSVPSAMAPPPNAQYNWVHDEFTPCSVSCGGGIQVRNVTCRSREELEVVEDSLCETIVKPVENQTCNTQACPARWVEGPWGACSKRCGKGGSRSRQVHCEKIIANGYPSIVADEECFELLGNKPPLFEKCNENASCPIWFTGPWKPCDKLCGEGKKTRQVVCYQKTNGRIEVLSDDQCEDDKPETEQPCLSHPCDGIDWVLSDWSGCDSCVSKIRTRTAICATKDYKVVNDSLCEYHKAPVLEEPCDRSKLPACEVQWYATQWSNCSAECGTGVQSRRVFCGLFDGESINRVDDSRCDNSSRYNDTKPCEVPKEKCPSKWFAGPWSECTVECGGGEQYRRVMCLRGSTSVSDCDPDLVLDSTQSCNRHSCNDDEMLPVSPNSTPIMDEDYNYEDCEDEEYPEVGADEDTSLSTEDMMFSDSPFTSELETEFITDTLSTEESGSGSTEHTFSIEDDWTTAETGSTDETIELSMSTEETSETSSITITTDSASTEPTLTSDSTTSSNISIATTEVIETSAASDHTDDTSVTVNTGTTETIESEITELDSTESESVTKSSSSEETVTTVSDSISSSSTESFDYTESDYTDFSTTESSTEETGSTESSSFTEEFTEHSSSTESDLTEGSSESSSTDETVSSESDTTESSISTETSSTESSSTDETTELVSSESTQTDSSGSTEENTEITTEISSTIESSSAIEISSRAESVSTTESSSSTESDFSTESSSSTESDSSAESSASTTESGATTESDSSAKFSSSTESSSTAESGSTEISTEPISTKESGSSTDSGSSEFGATIEASTTEAFSTEMTGSSSTEAASSTEVITTESVESSSSTEMIGSTSESATEETGSTESVSTEGISETSETGTSVTEEAQTTPTEISSATEETVSTQSTSEGSTESIEESTGSTPWDWSSTIELITKKSKCKAKIAKCTKSKFGCCPDKRTPAAGPFDEGCATPKTCAETKFKCCPDGVSPAAGPKDKGCPVAPCAETLFGCCKSDNKTAAEGNDQEGCPPPPPACKSSKYGCCNDTKTAATGPKKQGCPETVSQSEAKPKSCGSSEFGCCYDNATASPGPDGEGCPCNATEYGCCPDGVSIAEGAQMEGCVMSCNSSAYGCCPDGETPAHGYDFEGCCLLYAFGCCPDNYKPAEGPHLEGCGCQYAHYGCCPDNVTIARGPNNEGCGCDHSEHGCCPDRHTEASGPNNEGCDCSTFQFGCCDDGVTAAKGPGRQGCLCQQSQYGCCGDEKTPATGPDQAGCDCSTSKYGCCPDGVTAATGTKFLGCTDKPENRQAACALSTDRGPCTNYTVFWYYDIEYGGCSRFWYGGCEGNGNRFTSKEECEDVCVQPSPKEACNLPKVKGACTGYHPRWYYDAEREHCGQFIFGGCLGNANNFDTRELCQAKCEPAKSDDQCTLAIDIGPCAGNFPRWGFNAESRRCEQFTWGGCGGNTNRFSSEAACLHRCNPPGAPQLKDICTLPALTGECADYSEKWYYDTAIKRCRQFYYGGCGGNENRFSTQQECENQCRERPTTTVTTPRPTPPVTAPAPVENVCALPSETGGCDQYTEKWFFDSSINRCRPFYYGGCGGNENRFENERECEARCAPPAPAPQAPPSTGQEICFLGVDAGPCTNFAARWAYDSERGACVPFRYGGCGGNQNNFPDEEYCHYTCGTIQDICQLPMLQGPCDESLMRWFYDPTSDSCSQFAYGGCNGNGNRFESREACESRCRTGPAGPEVPAATKATTTQSPAGEGLSPECLASPSADEECVEDEAGPVWYLDVSQHACVIHDNEPSGNRCRRAGAFYSEEACERTCGAFRDIDVCRSQMDPGSCGSAIPKFFYNQTLDACVPFTYSGCHGGPNRFSSEQECLDICKDERSYHTTDPCKRRPKRVDCVDYETTWFFDESRDECFFYGSCDHSDTTRFTSREQCEGQCRRAPAVVPVITTTTRSPPPPAPSETVEDECRTPSVTDACTQVAYYYDARSGSCHEAKLGGCGLVYAHPTEEACLRRCGAFRGTDPCRSKLDVGLGVESIIKFYWKQSSGRCEQYIYSGSGGGPNRFSTIEECEQTCGHTGPDIESNEVLPDCDRFNEECAVIRCEFGVQRSRTRDGCERCTCVQVEVDCAPLQRECETLKCAYGLERAIGPDGCERCTCLKHPCVDKQCPAGERCVASTFRDPVTQDISYTADCHQVNKAGSCPVEETTVEGQCRRECNDDADCRGVGKCCTRGCSQLCLAPASDQHAPPTTTYSPELPQAPQANPVTEPEVSGTEGGKATLRCLFHGNPPPKITWRRGEITIDGDVGRYRLLSDGALEIVSLYRNDSGVYICVAENVHGVSRQEIRLQVNDPVEAPVGISGDSNAVVTGELGRSLNIRCLAYGHPTPAIYWYRGRTMLPYSSQQYEARGNVLQIRRLSVDTLGEYACQAYNGVGKAALWTVVVRAYETDEDREHEYLVPREQPPTPTRAQARTTTTLAPEIDVPIYTVAVNTSFPMGSVSAAAGAELSIPCDVEGYPVPDVYWTKDGARLTPTDRIALTEARLTISALTIDDSGVYGCHARNDYSSHSSTIQVNVQGLYIPVHCTDNPFFADCHLIVKSKYCNHHYYSRFCCKSCVEAGQLNPLTMDTQADEAWKKKK